MNVLFLTVFLSVLLAAFFVGGFLYHLDRASGDPRRDSLLPFTPEGRTDGGAPSVARKTPSASKPSA